MPKPFARLDPGHPEASAFLKDPGSLSVWEMLRRLGKPSTVADVARACALKPERVLAALDQATALGVAERLNATSRDPRIRYRALGEQLLVVADHSDPAVRALLSEGFGRAVAESRRTIDASMAESVRHWSGAQTLHQMIDLPLDDEEARELMALCEALRSFIDRTYDRADPGSALRRPTCNYHLAVHLAPVSGGGLPAPRIQFVEKSTVSEVESAVSRRATRLLSPRERTVARMLSQGKTRRAVAEELGIAQSTVSTLCERIYRKLGISRRAQLAIRLHAIGEG